jgi:hypothetical protein
MSALTTELDNIFFQIITPLEVSGEIISPVKVAVDMDKIIDPDRLSPELKTWATIEHIKHYVRTKLAKRHDPVKKANDYIENDTDDLFGDELQPYYPVRRNSEPVYVPRQDLTEHDVERIVKRMTRAGESLQTHARALKAEFLSRAA